MPQTPDYAAWIGREERSDDQIDLRSARALAATLDLDPQHLQPGDALPPLWHWVYFTPTTRQSGLGPDGHPERGGFLPPVTLPRRMWAGGRVDFRQPLRIGDAAKRESRILRCERKDGRSGELVFVTVRHSLHGPAGLALVEEHDIVYRAGQPGGTPLAGETPPAQADFRRRVHPDAPLLFRYSALTFNGHRIHYDRKYVTEVEGYPGLVVHGPMIATLLLDLLRHQMPDAELASFEFRAVRPTFDIHHFFVNGAPSADGKTIHLWAEDHEGWLTMDATAVLK